MQREAEERAKAERAKESKEQKASKEAQKKPELAKPEPQKASASPSSVLMLQQNIQALCSNTALQAFQALFRIRGGHVTHGGPGGPGGPQAPRGEAGPEGFFRHFVLPPFRPGWRRASGRSKSSARRPGPPAPHPLLSWCASAQWLQAAQWRKEHDRRNRNLRQV